MARYVVRYGVMRVLGVFSTRADRHERGAKVIARTNRGLEVGEVLCEATEQALSQFSDPPGGQIVREMTSDDRNEWDHIRGREGEEFDASRRHVRELGLDMQLVDLEHLYGGERVVVYYVAENRIDFRELVKRLASEFQTRIEMRQIGVRDEAKLLADFGDCGKPVCCNSHLFEMPPVSMKMAKLQKATLDPTKISGRCGRLKCCLRYEFDTYEELQKTLPPIGAEVVTNSGRARILNHEILAQQLLVQMEDNRRLLIDASEVVTVLHVPSSGGGRRDRDGGRRDRGDRERGERDQDRNDRERSDRSQGDRSQGERNQGERNQGDGSQVERDQGVREAGDDAAS